MKLFISYSRDDKAWVYELWRALRDRAHHDAWIDQRLVPAQDWWEGILQSIESCECCIYVMTPKSVESIYCTAEVEYALALNKPIIPLMLKSCDTPAEIRRRRIQYSAISDTEGLGDVLFTVERALGNVRDERYQGKYAPSQPAPQRPDEPTPERKPEQVSEVYMLAEEAALANNFTLAEKLFQQVIDADPQGYGRAAIKRLTEIRFERTRILEYTTIMQMAAKPSTQRGAAALWDVFTDKYGTDFDPEGLAQTLDRQPLVNSPRISPTPTTPPKTASNVPSPAPPRSTDPMQEALERAQTFSGKRNRDWTPFLVTFSDLKVPDMPFCLVPVGSFQMGEGKEAHPQTITQPYTIAQYPVTNAQWAIGVKADVVKEPEGDNALKWYKDSAMTDAPVVGVTWFAVKSFAEWLGCRLPTELEWEYAARGVESLVYPWGNDWKPEWCVWDGKRGGKPAVVKNKPEGMSWVSARHLSGNVWEWTSSLFESYPYRIDDGRERDTGNKTDVLRVLRGGSWELINTVYFRAAYRGKVNPNNWSSYGGFRIARSLK